MKSYPNREKIRLAILFGGRSPEHTISLVSAREVLARVDRSRYDPVPIGIDRTGTWQFLTERECSLLFRGEHPQFTRAKRDLSLFDERAFRFSPCTLKRYVDVLFPLLHGPFGEDGTVQGLARLADIPCIGSSVLGSALCMDKEVTKRLMQAAGISVVPFRCLRRGDDIDPGNRVGELGLPLFVKPANMGSSIGIRKVTREDALPTAVAEALRHDDKVLIEKCIVGREIECAVLGNRNPEASVLGEIVTRHDFYSYEAKYSDPGGTTLSVPATLPARTGERVRRMALRAFALAECRGMARVDFFVTPEGTPLFSEINTVPGFTPISLYPLLWEASGIDYATLIDRLVTLAMENHGDEPEPFKNGRGSENGF
ncbi:MAG: D-alanine--D-alanine ligase [Simkaniaceae bacterium]|nr:D-alanine--D-alanine ligase [Simkaniaceae bacterium]